MKLAKDRLDVGLTTDDPGMLAFMAEEVGLGEPEVLPISKQVAQHRFEVDGSVLKVNLMSRLESRSRSGYAEVLIADSGITTARTLTGPDDVVVTLLPPGDRRVTQLGVRLRVPNRAAAQGYFAGGLGLRVEGALVRVGASVILLDEDPDAPTAVAMPARGWSYLTLQIFDCDEETAAAVSRGAALAQPAVTLGEVARFSMIADSWGNQLELSQRASLTGPLSPS